MPISPFATFKICIYLFHACVHGYYNMCEGERALLVPSNSGY